MRAEQQDDDDDDDICFIEFTKWIADGGVFLSSAPNYFIDMAIWWAGLLDGCGVSVKWGPPNDWGIWWARNGEVHPSQVTGCNGCKWVHDVDIEPAA